MQCSEVRKFVYVYLDGEFEPRECAEFEQHVQGCPSCGETLTLEQTFHGLLRKRLERPAAPAGLRERILAEIDQEDRETSGPLAKILALPTTVKAIPALAAAALAVLLVWPRGSAEDDLPIGARAAGAAVISSAEEPIDSLVTEAVAVHEVNLPAEVSGDRETIRRFVATNAAFRAAPPFRDTETTHLVDARRVRVGTVPAIRYTYLHRGKRLTVVQFPESVAAGAARPRFRRAVFTDRRGPYNIAVYRDREHGLSHSVVGDVDERELMGLIPASYSPER